MSALSSMLAEWLGRNGFSSADAANVLGCPVPTFRGWLAGRSEPDYFTRCAVERQMREGHNPFMRYVQRISARWHARFAAEVECDGPIVYCSHS